MNDVLNTRNSFPATLYFRAFKDLFHMKDYQISSFKRAMSWPYLKNSLIVMLVVGTALNLINQGDVLTGAAPVDISKLLMTYLMPFLVVSFGTWSALCQAAKEEKEAKQAKQAKEAKLEQ